MTDAGRGEEKKSSRRSCDMVAAVNAPATVVVGARGVQDGETEKHSRWNEKCCLNTGISVRTQDPGPRTSPHIMGTQRHSPGGLEVPVSGTKKVDAAQNHRPTQPCSHVAVKTPWFLRR